MPTTPSIALGVEVLEHVAVVDLARARLVAARVVARLQVRDLVPGHVDVRDEIPFGDLLVIDVEQNLARRAADRAANLIRLRNLVQEHARVIREPVQRLEHHHQPVRLEDLRSTA